MPDPREHAEIQDISKDECFDRWQGTEWVPNEENPDLGTCQSDYDFDAWAAEHEGEQQ